MWTSAYRHGFTPILHIVGTGLSLTFVSFSILRCNVEFSASKLSFTISAVLAWGGVCVAYIHTQIHSSVHAGN